MSALLEVTINTLAIGGLYGLIALGYTLVYGILRFINFAHSDIVAWGGWIALTIASAAGWLVAGGAPFVVVPVVLLVTMALSAILGVAIEFFAYRPLRKAPRLNVLITAIGVSLLLQNVGLQDAVFGKFPNGKLRDLLTNDALAQIGNVSLRLYDALTIVLAIVLVVALERLVYRTKLGRAMRAVSYDERTASLMGINVNRIVAVTFAIGSALAAAGGILYGLRNTLQITPHASWVLLGLKAFVAAVVGGIGNVRGAAAGALLIAFVEIFVHFYLIEACIALFGAAPQWVGQLQDVYVFAILILVLLFKPSGMFGTAAVEKV